MTGMVKPALVHAIMKEYALPVLGRHGLGHWARVLENGLRLAEATGANRQVVALFGVFHDSRRENDGTDPGHGARGGELASRLRDAHLDLSDHDFDLLVYACAHHTDGTVDGDITVQTCWDADRLDLWRVPVTPQNAFLCTSAARDRAIQEWSRERSVADYTPDYVREDWLRGLVDRQGGIA